MGYTIHHSIVVTSWDSVALKRAHEFALGTGAAVTPIAEGVVNGFASFLVAPDGSKEGWEESATGDERRRLIKDYYRAQAYSDGSNALEWYEVEFPEDAAPRVVDHQRKRVRRG